MKPLPHHGTVCVCVCVCVRVPHSAAGGLHAGLHPECHTHTHTRARGTTRDFKVKAWRHAGFFRNGTPWRRYIALHCRYLDTKLHCITQRSRYRRMQCSLQCLRFQVLSALMLKIEVLRYATPCRSDLTPNMKALVFSKTSGTIIQRNDVKAQKTWNFQTRSRLAQTILKTAATDNPEASVTVARLHGISLPKHVSFSPY